MKTAENKKRLLILGWVISILAALFYCYEYLLRIEPSVMSSQIMHHFMLTSTGFGVLIGMYYYIYAPMQAAVGVVTDYFGPKKTLTFAIGFCALGVLLFAATNSYAVAAIGRLLIGFGSAFAFVGVLKLAAMWLPRKYFATFVGITTSLGMIGAMVGDVALTSVVEHVGWHAVLYGSAVVGLILIPVFIFFVSEHRAEEKAEIKTVKQLANHFLQIVKSWQLWCAGIIGCMLYLSLSAFAELWGIPFLHALSHNGHVEAISLVNSMVFLGWLVGSPFNGWLSDKVQSRKKPMIVGSLLAAATIGVILLVPHLPLVMIGFLLFLFGVFASVENLAFVIARERAGVQLTGTAVSFINLVVMLSGLIFQPMVGWILDLNWSGLMAHGHRVYTFADYRVALIAIPIAMLVAMLLAFTLKETYFLTHKKHG